MRAVFKWLAKYHTELLGVAGLEDLTLQEHKAIFNSVVDKDHEAAAKKVSDHILRINGLYSKPHKK